MKTDALLEAYRLYHDPLFLYALSLTHSPQDADDLVSETFVRALVSFDGSGNLRSWLYKVLKNCFTDEWRRKKYLVHPDRLFLEQIEDNRFEVERLAEQYDEQRRWLYAKIYTLKPLERNVILLSMTSGMDDKSIAGLLNITEENLRVIRFRTKEKLKKMAEKEGVR